ncbi:YHS domain-containing protein [Sulfitobacter sp. F26204]|uniref:YHS domain-containing (seleno)protein n=1 Tax=Sulfitobacter sp. F26204 TaxID=2996014 RepID=UPI00225E6611|nr:YHS domain-containing (seleno)protein [Sulfitobacter sp. F26204]MCX7558983.1 YHS domain-containing protein [Sulfitobacter sp. F26204]
MNRFTLTIAAAATALSLAGEAFAGDQYIDATGFAASGFDVVAYFDLDPSPIGQPQPAAIPGKAAFTADYNGATFAFSTKENRDKFVADPAQYAPQYDGHCAYGVSKGGKVPGNPNLWRIVDGKLYLNITKNVVSFWEEDIPGNINLAEGNWASIEPEAGSTSPIPRYTSTAPLK